MAKSNSPSHDPSAKQVRSADLHCEWISVLHHKQTSVLDCVYCSLSSSFRNILFYALYHKRECFFTLYRDKNWFPVIHVWTIPQFTSLFLPFLSLHSFLPAYMYMTREAWVTWRNTWFSISLLYLNGDGNFLDRYRKGYYVVPIFMANQNLIEKIYIFPRLDLYSLSS